MTGRAIFASGLLCVLASPAFAASLVRPERAVQFVAFGLLFVFVVTVAVISSPSGGLSAVAARGGDDLTCAVCLGQSWPPRHARVTADEMDELSCLGIPQAYEAMRRYLRLIRVDSDCETPRLLRV